jgi:acetyl esterase/lipase
MMMPGRSSLAALGLIALGTLSLGAAEGGGEESSKLTAGEAEVRRHLSAEEFEVITIRLWPGEPPDEPRPIPGESAEKGARGMHILNVTQPSITVARPKNLPAPAPAVLVCPGGGYGSVGIDSGGVDVMNWLKQRGVTGVYLKYRVPKRGRGFEMGHQPLQDIQRAMSLLRSRAKALRIDPDRIGVIGFSAGGNLAALLTVYHRPEDRRYAPVDAADQVGCRPDFVAMVAPAYLTTPILSDQLTTALRPDNIARNLTPPTFLASAVTDKFTVGACHYFLLLREKRVPAEFHVYERGGHAEGIHEGADNQWPHMFEDWMRRRGIIGGAKGGE